jgi:N-acetylmuramoyl-L-alanine amidase
MKMKRERFPRVVLTLFLLVTPGLRPVFADTSSSSLPDRIVFIDPGHGGEDTGARGPGGTLEKNISLQLARLISDRLPGGYHCKLSRTDNYSVDIFDRTSFANEAKADLFFSLHVNGSFRNGANGFSLYFYALPKKPDLGTHPAADHSADGTTDQEPWQRVQLKHFSESRQLARFIRNRLGQFSDEPAVVTGADALVLAGADMPAILFEIGNLTNPLEEKKLRDPTYLARIADAICAGIKDFLGDNPGISSMDLHP